MLLQTNTPCVAEITKVFNGVLTKQKFNESIVLSYCYLLPKLRQLDVLNKLLGTIHPLAKLSLAFYHA